MSRTLSKQFTDTAKPAKPKRRRPSSLSIRVSDEERAILQRKAGKRSIGAYVREKALGDEQAPRRRSVAKPSIDSVLLGKVLGKFGQSEQVTVLFLLLAAAENERVTMGKKDRAALHAACADMREVRALVMGALGLRGEEPSYAKASED
ncbi:hypothetical protein [Oceanibaculum indicum]|uniref:Uncharacterized protein n=1 Tax=Oceanibaculum indicum P24 TaxID=1207063 RepID=K2J4T4_9PROT|nr:hypothetical protein [Oceanibaculum indicum]EKE78041.1 hypothetical protein P24_03410 [Oceanibaculum indicum P24]